MTPTLSDLQRENAELRRMLQLTGKQLKAALEVVATTPSVNLSDWWFVRVYLRSEDKTPTWITQAAFKHRPDAENWQQEWLAITGCEIFQLSSPPPGITATDLTTGPDQCLTSNEK